MLEIWFAFAAGFTGSFHCIGMCGGVVAALSLRDGAGAFGPKLRSQLGYNLGRILTYTFLGALAGLAGASLDLVALKSASYWFLFAANVAVIMVGLSTALGLDALGISAVEGKAGQLLARPLKRALSAGSPLSSFPLGLALGFLPCGLVYAPLIAAAGSGSALSGAATMAALGAGTLPVMLAFGTASSAVSLRLKSVMLRLSGVALALMGTAGLWHALGR